MKFRDLLDFGDALTFICLVILQFTLLALGILVFFGTLFYGTPGI